MRKDIFLLILGILVYSVPFLGIPNDWKNNLLYLLGVAIVLIAIVNRLSTRKLERSTSEVYYEENEPIEEVVYVDNV